MCSITQEREKETESVWGVCVCVCMYLEGATVMNKILYSILNLDGEDAKKISVFPVGIFYLILNLNDWPLQYYHT